MNVVYSGQRALGFLLPRGRAGIEAFTITSVSVGLFPDQQFAADAIPQQRGRA